VGHEIVQQLKGHVIELFRRILATALRRAVVGATFAGGADLAKQELDINVFHSRTHIDLTEVAGATGTGAVLGAVLPGPRRTRAEDRNGYRFTFDKRDRTTDMEGTLVLNPSQGRDRAVQLLAGGKDRKPTDVGAHYVGRRFNGPLDDFNHFAQDGDFNNGSYKALENKWQKALDAGKLVQVRVKVSYPGDSLRPSRLEVVYKIDGKPWVRKFENGPSGQ
jgi:DNA/RNA non-specific endonuclease